jgi:hypothetical protein
MMGNEQFTIQDGVSFARGVRMIEDDRRAREAEQLNKDSFAAADLLDKASAAGDKDPETARQLTNQFKGYSPEARFHAATIYANKRSKDAEATTSAFKQNYAEATNTYREASSMMDNGDTEGGMKRMVDVYNKNIRDGKRYDVEKDGEDYRLVQKDAHGKEIASFPVNPHDFRQSIFKIVQDPSVAFKTFHQGEQDRNTTNLELREKMEVVTNGKQTLYHYQQINKATGKLDTIWQDSDTGKQVAEPKPEDGFRLLKQVQDEKHKKGVLDQQASTLENSKQELTNRKLDADMKRLGIKKAQQELDEGPTSEKGKRDKEIHAAVRDQIEEAFNEKGKSVNKDGDVVVQQKNEETGKMEWLVDEKASAAKRKAERELFMQAKKDWKKGDDPTTLVNSTHGRLMSEKQKEMEDRAREHSKMQQINSERQAEREAVAASNKGVSAGQPSGVTGEQKSTSSPEWNEPGYLGKKMIQAGKSLGRGIMGIPNKYEEGLQKRRQNQ